MNKFIKYFTKVALVLLGIGIVFTLIGALIGGFSALNNYSLPFNMPYFTHKEIIVENIEEYHGITIENKIIIDDLTNIRGLDLQMGGAKAIIDVSSDDKIYIEANQSDAFGYNIEFDTLVIYKLGNRLNNNALIKIYLPSSMFFDEVVFGIGASDVTVNQLNAQNVYADLGAGKLAINNSTIDYLSIEVGAGSGELNNVVANDVNLSVGLGNINYSGQINQSLEAEVAMGSLNMLLVGDEKMYNYNIDQAIGQMEVGSFKIAGLASERYIDNGANSEFDLSCAVGSMVIKFKQ